MVHWSTLSATARERWRYCARTSCSSRCVIAYSDTRYRAEKLMLQARARAARHRSCAGMLVGDRAPGRLRRVEGLHLLIADLLSLRAELAAPDHGAADSPCKPCPSTTPSKLGLALARARETVGRTFHIVETAPPSLREVLERCAPCWAGRRHVGQRAAAVRAC